MLRTTLTSALSLLSCAACLIAAPTVALAQDNEEGFNKKGDDIIAADKQAAEEKATGDKMPGEKDKKAEEEAAAKSTGPDPNDPREDPLKSYYFIGLRFRNIVIPKFILNIFADGGSTVNVFSFGPEFTSRKKRIQYDIGLSYADYSMDEFLFKGSSDGNDAWEMVSSDMKVFYANIDILYEVWSHPSGQFSFLVGGGIGVGGVIGNLYRTQVYPNDPNNLNPDDTQTWRKCTGPTPGTNIDPTTGNTFCDASNVHFYDENRDPKDYSDPSWANGGSKPFIFPWLSIPQVSFRYKPIKQFQARADLGFSVTGFYFGLSAAYGL
jgi:hypothetical protein